MPADALRQPVPVSVSTAKAGHYTFALDETLTPDRNMLTQLYLYDKLTGQYADLLLGEYSCTLQEGSGEGRFFLTSVPQGVATADNSLNAVTSYATAEHIEVFTPAGACLYAGPPEGLIYSRLPQGPALIRLQNGNGVTVHKVNIR